MNFLSTLAARGTLSTKAKAAIGKKPANVAFAKQISKQIGHLQGIPDLLKPRAVWSVQHADGTVSVCLKNGVQPLQLDGASNILTLKNVADAVQFLNDAMAAALAGEFDALLAATQPKRGVKKAVL